MCTGGKDGTTALSIVATSALVLWFFLYVWTLIHLARSAARGR